MAGVSTLCSVCLTHSAGLGVSGTVHSMAKAMKTVPETAAAFLAESSKPLSKTPPIDNLPIGSLSMGERTGSRVFYHLWSYVLVMLDLADYMVICTRMIIMIVVVVVVIVL